MKKRISILLSMLLVLSFTVIGVTPASAESSEEEELKYFTEGISRLIQKYDTEKNFEISPRQIPQNNTAASFSASLKSELETETKYSFTDFQTARLIVRVNGKFNKHGALEDISGFEDFHILQYESPEEAMEVYAELQAEKNVTDVEPDLIVKMISDEQTEPTETDEKTQTSEHLTPWSLQRTQADRLLDYLETADITMKEVTVAVIDSGIDYNHEFLKNRVYRTKFNSSDDGTPNDEMDVEISHGTMVASVIADNTPDNVHIKGYKAIDNNEYGSTSGATAAILKAVTDKVNVINLSIFFMDAELNVAALESALDADISVVCASGNNNGIQTYFAPPNISDCITVGATDRNNIITEFSDSSWNVDVSAPGQEILVAKINNQYKLSNGTSFSSPCVASLAAIIRSIYPDMSRKQIEKKIKDTSQPVNNVYGYVSRLNGSGMVQFCNALDISPLTGVETNLTEYKYNEPKRCTLSCADKSAKILFTTDGTYPDVETANEYKSPIYIDEFANIRAVAYYENSGYYSKETEFTVRIRTLGDEKDFTITDDGIIKNYSGNVGDLIIPDTINGITVTGMQKGAFNDTQVYGLTLPKTITELPKAAFLENETLLFIEGEGVVTIESQAFKDAKCLLDAEFPNVVIINAYGFKNTHSLRILHFDKLEQIETEAFNTSGVYEFYAPMVTTVNANAFKNCEWLEIIYLPNWYTSKTSGLGENSGYFIYSYSLDVVNFPKLQVLKNGTFHWSNIRKAYLPSVTEIDNAYVFADCQDLEYVYMPNLKSIPGKAFDGAGVNRLIHTTLVLDNVKKIEKNAFNNASVNRLEFSHLETANSLPNHMTIGRYPFCIIAMPSTFKECTVDTKGRNYKVYGTKGTYAEQWAIENGHEFIEISQETAVLTQLPEQYTDADDVLTADVIGFNRTYQWYASDKPDNTAGTPIEGATDREFNPEDYPAAKYYYCVVTSTDVGYDPIEIRTDITENMTLNPADYSKVEKAKSEIPEDLSVYTDESVKALQDILDNIDYSLDETEQSKVDDYAKAIEEAVNSLEYKPADYTEYNKAVEKANALDRSLYQDLTALDETLKTDVSGKNITEQTVVDEQTKAIEEAINALEYKPADYTEYNKAVEKANALDRSLYQDLTALDNALSIDVKNKNITEQAVIDKQAKAIEEAIEKLEYKEADYTEYNKAVEKAKSLDRNLYQDLTALDEALNVDVSGKNITEQAVVDEQTKAIETAINSLKYKPADYSKLNFALAQVPSDLSIYTDESVQRLNSVIENLNYNLNITEQDKADKQVEALLEAINTLEYKPADYMEYNKAVEKANALDRNLYQDLTALDNALLVDVKNKNITEQSVVNEQTQAILEAIDALEYKPADYAEVEKAKAQIPEDLSVYTDGSVSELQEVLNAVDYSLNITQQATVDGYAQAIIDAVNALELKPVEPPITEEPTKPDATKPGVSEGTTKPSVPEESTTLPDSQKTDIPKTGGTASVSYTVALLTLLSACIYITSRKRRS